MHDRSQAAQDDLLAAIREAKALFPDLRTGQIIANVVYLVHIYGMEDRDMAAHIRVFYAKLAATP